jgi:hypothetical protein
MVLRNSEEGTMLIMDMPPETPGKVPVLMAQVRNEKRGNVVVQDLIPFR